jgi:hypothetical protein
MSGLRIRALDGIFWMSIIYRVEVEVRESGLSSLIYVFWNSLLGVAWH